MGGFSGAFYDCFVSEVSSPLSEFMSDALKPSEKKIASHSIPGVRGEEDET